MDCVTVWGATSRQLDCPSAFRWSGYRSRFSPASQRDFDALKLLGFPLFLCLPHSMLGLGQRNCHLLATSVIRDSVTTIPWLLSWDRSLVARVELHARTPCHPRVWRFTNPLALLVIWLSNQIPSTLQRITPCSCSFPDIVLLKYCPATQQ